MANSEKKLSLGIFGTAKNGQNKYLMVKHAYGLKKWSLPGGGFEQGEFFSDACVRETLEETGLAVVVKHLIGQFTLVKSKGGLILYETTVVGGEINPANPSEISECEFLSKNTIRELWEKDLVYDAQYSLILWSETPPRPDGLPHEGWLTVPPTLKS
ncbi:MAG: hypothetical protein A3B86_02510 [Candidatus Yanofskybacteria bacterium RIFCSPHIGHO2_02_FULL_38_22b]|uniref:Nudix hydrolase domain-containing protein n=1 Tax=Candidatus Yanofskybacteria bacterium RIFCSPHIGHO2_02_FULL_38_22b TaxID=1802673 RepID=A0A1F8F3G4_9BACT|nr:MAG: hypothetical protein A3B86_02510 [Candidatus Yanofskybacteria bacterium RIFCSPHIGHO2_02_FULL_38_22b]OGN20316.1 MAG: hypothetical protein A2910_03345 [Candidatus Yanofskybacteria bacterium RIFCSPLOWO2_01_FULL_39_28]